MSRFGFLTQYESRIEKMSDQKLYQEYERLQTKLLHVSRDKNSGPDPYSRRSRRKGKPGNKSGSGPPKKTEEMFCVCRQPNDGRKYIQCEGDCGNWFHPGCVGLSDDVDLDTAVYRCEKCKRKTKSSKDADVYTPVVETDYEPHNKRKRKKSDKKRKKVKQFEYEASPNPRQKRKRSGDYDEAPPRKRSRVSSNIRKPQYDSDLSSEEPHDMKKSGRKSKFADASSDSEDLDEVTRSGSELGLDPKLSKLNLNDLMDEIVKMEKKLVKMKMNSAHGSKITDLQESISELKKENEGLEEQTEDLRSDLNIKTSEVEMLKERLKSADTQLRKHKQKAKERLEKERQEHEKHLQSLRGQSGGYSDRSSLDDDHFSALQEIERHRDMFKQKYEEASTKLLQMQAKVQDVDRKNQTLMMQNAQLISKVKTANLRRNQFDNSSDRGLAEEKLWLEKQYSKQLESHYQQLVACHKKGKEEGDQMETIRHLKLQLEEERNKNRRLQNREKDKEEHVHSPTNASKSRRKKAEKKPNQKNSKRKKRPVQSMGNSGVVIQKSVKTPKKRQMDKTEKKIEECFVCREKIPKRQLLVANEVANGTCPDVLVCRDPWYVFHTRCLRQKRLNPQLYFDPPKVAAE